MQKKVALLTLVLFFVSFCSTEKANADQKFWCIATSELLNNFPHFNDSTLSREYSDDLIENLKIYDKTFKISIEEMSVGQPSTLDIQYDELTKLIKKEDSDALYLCKIWANKNNTNFEQITESKVGKDNSK